jgi:hypothetical protein
MKAKTFQHFTQRKRMLLIFLWAVSLGAQAADSNLEILVPFTRQTDFSMAVWTAITNSSAAKSTLLTNCERFEYDSKRDKNLIKKTQEKINNLSSNSYLLVLGPSSTKEADELEASITNSNPRVLFLSPSITAKVQGTNIPILGACLPDTKRIASMGDSAPKCWKKMTAVFVGECGSWGEQIYTNLCAQTNSFAISGPPILVDTKYQDSTNRYQQAAAHCVHDNVQLIFLALGEPSNVKRFLRAIKETDKGGPFHAYRPCVCLLGDYRFAPGDMNGANSDPLIITEDFASVASIAMASEAEMGHEGTNLFVDLDRDLISLLAGLYAKSGGHDPESFFCEITNAFGAATVIESPSQQDVISSRYLRYRLEQDQTLSPVILKWLQSPLAGGKPSWQRLTPDLHSYYLDAARAKVPWLIDWRLTGLVVVTICVGWFMECRKRFIFLQKRFASHFLKSIAWCLIILVTLLVIFGLGWTGSINSASFGWVLAVCVSPMALLPMLQHLAFTKVPSLDKVLELPSSWLEKGLDRCINSRAVQLCAIELETIERELKAADPNAENREGALLSWWLGDLQKIGNQDKARRVMMRFLPNLKLWEALPTEVRVKHLREALAYTRVILNSEAK